MAIWDLRPKTDVVTGVAVGVGVIAAPVVVPLVWSIVRPVLKAALKGGFMLYETGRGVFGASAEAPIEKPQETAAKAKSPQKPQSRKKATTGGKKVAVKVLTPEAATSLRSQAKSAAEKPKKDKEEGTKETPRDES